MTIKKKGQTKTDLEQLIGIFSQFDRDIIKQAVISAGLDREISRTGDINILAGSFRPELAISKLGAFSYLPGLPILPSILSPLPVFSDGSIDELIDLIKRYLNNPGEIITGPRSTGSRGEIVASVKRSCTEPVEQRCPLNEAEMEFSFKEFDGNNFEVRVKITWQYDCCNIYNADATYTIVEIPDQDITIIMTENYSIPAADPIELKVCQPCNPKCLRAQISLITLVQERAQIIPGTRRKIDIDVTLCPSSNGLPRVLDNTSASPTPDDYTIQRTLDPRNRSGQSLGGGQQ
jgi:hypothetical protein